MTQGLSFFGVLRFLLMKTRLHPSSRSLVSAVRLVAKRVSALTTVITSCSSSNSPAVLVPLSPMSPKGPSTDPVPVATGFRVVRFPRSVVRVLALAAALIGMMRITAEEISLAWDADSDPGVAGYRIYRGRTSGSYDWSIDAGPATQHTVGQFNPGILYFFVVTAYAPDGNESDPSNEISYQAMDSETVPVALAQSHSIPQASALSIVLQALNPDGDAASFTVVRRPNSGMLFGLPPNLYYFPNATFIGTDSFTFTVSDGLLTSAPATVTIAVGSVDDTPIALGQSLSLEPGTALPIVLHGSDLDGSALTYAVVQPPSSGLLFGSAPNLYYFPDSDFTGTDSFTFTVSDGAWTSPPATVTITVQKSNHPPVALAQSQPGLEDTDLPLTLSGWDPDGDPLTFTIVQPPDWGTLSGTPPNLIYVPTPNHFGPDSFTFSADDGLRTSAPATVTISVERSNHPPVALAQSAMGWEDTALPLTLSGSDPDGDRVSFSIVQFPVRGSLSGTPPNITYTPAPGFVGTDSFTFLANDGQLTSAPATVTLTVGLINHVPVALPQNQVVLGNSALPLTLTGSDPDGGRLSFTVVRRPSSGMLFGTPPNLYYFPRSDFIGTDSFTFTVSDGKLTSTPATVAISVVPPISIPTGVGAAMEGLPPEGPPDSHPDALVVLPGGLATALVSGATSVLANDGGPEGGLRAELMMAPAHGQLQLNWDGTFRYDHDGGLDSGDSFTYLVRNGSGAGAGKTVTVSIFRVTDSSESANERRFSFSGQEGADYRVEYNVEAGAPGTAWQPFTGWFPGSEGPIQVVDISPDGEKHFRVVCSAGGGTLISDPISFSGPPEPATAGTTDQ